MLIDQFPAPKIVAPHPDNWGKSNRRWTATWLVGEPVMGQNGKMVQKAARLSTSHWASRKALASLLQPVDIQVEKDGPFTVETYNPMDAKSLGAPVPVARFSQKALKAEFEDAVECVKNWLDDVPSVQVIFGLDPDEVRAQQVQAHEQRLGVNS